ncbi:MAG: CHAT domain-containing protein, partial [Ignavibacteriales bacterium]|nr:CHAT domain-containing protein [Ignavibacteriales bacterium]
MGRYEDAEQLYLKALEITRQQLGENHPDYAGSLNNLGLLYYNMGRYEDAEQLYIKAVEIYRQQLGENHPDYALSLNNLGLLYDHMGRYEEARKHFSEEFRVRRSIIIRQFPAMSEKEKEAFFSTMANSFEHFHSFAVDYYEEEPEITREMYDRVLFTKGLIFYSTERVRRAVAASDDEELRALYDEWLTSRASLARLYGMTKDERAQTGVNLDSLERAANDYEKELGRRSAVFEAEQSIFERDWRDVRDALAEGEAAVEIVRIQRYDKEWTDDVYYLALVVTPGCEAPALAVTRNGAEIEEKIAKRYLGSLHHEQTDATTEGAGDEPYRSLWRPIEEKLGDARTVYVSLDGVYNTLNVGALVDPSSGRYLMDKYDLRIVGSTKSLADAAIPGDALDAATLFGYPDYDLSGERLASLSSRYGTRGGGGSGPYGATLDSMKRAVLSDLPGTKAEVELIESALESAGWDVSANLGDAAIEEAVKAVESPKILHLATHGYFLRDRELGADGALVGGFETARATENPLLRSGLYLAGAKNTLVGDRPAPGVDDGILTAYEAQHLNLRGTELVVLSACETGLGEVRNGEGVYGLRRAFQFAGAEAVLMSLWKVSDDATQKLMTYFFDNWLGGMGKREAFRTAQRKLREEYPHPYYWASFVFVGR